MNNVRNLLTGSLVYIACIVLLSLACNVSSGLPVADVGWIDDGKKVFSFYTGFVGIGNAGGH